MRQEGGRLVSCIVQEADQQIQRGLTPASYIIMSVSKFIQIATHRLIAACSLVGV